MRLVALAILSLSSIAHADRQPVATLGFVAADVTYANTRQDPNGMLGGRFTLSFEDAPLALPPPDAHAIEARLVPELLVGFISDDHHAIGTIGAGLRGEIQMARNAGTFLSHAVAYAAVRATISGAHQDAGTELMLGEYLPLRHGTRFGWEGGLGSHRSSDGASPEVAIELIVYAGWKL